MTGREREDRFQIGLSSRAVVGAGAFHPVPQFGARDGGDFDFPGRVEREPSVQIERALLAPDDDILIADHRHLSLGALKPARACRRSSAHAPASSGERSVEAGARQFRAGAAVLETVRGLAADLAAATAAAGLTLRGLGIGVGELADCRGGLASGNCVEWRGLPVQETLGAVAPVVFEADVRAAALAEARLGAGQPYPIFLYVTVGTGISCCLMLAGKPYLGTRGLTGTMACSTIVAPCERCGHTTGPSLEEVASGPGLVARYRAAGGEAKDGRAVLAAAAAGNEAARRIVQSASDALGSQVALPVNTLEPGAVVLGGGLGLSEGPFWEHFREAARRHIWSPLNRGLPILRAETGPDAGWIGAALKAADTFCGTNHSTEKIA